LWIYLEHNDIPFFLLKDYPYLYKIPFLLDRVFESLKIVYFFVELAVFKLLEVEYPGKLMFYSWVFNFFYVLSFWSELFFYIKLLLSFLLIWLLGWTEWEVLMFLPKLFCVRTLKLEDEFDYFRVNKRSIVFQRQFDIIVNM
jgi:hypothetical protein